MKTPHINSGFLIASALFLLIVSSCNNTKSLSPGAQKREKYFHTEGQIVKPVTIHLLDTTTCGFKDADMVDITWFSDQFIIDIRYASKDNFLDTILYPCAKCLLRYEVVKALLRAQSEFDSLGFKIKLYDCYRPHSVQKIMWKKMPVVGLVADPSTGSRHNRGTAIDLTITDQKGNEIDMGTKHDDLSKMSRTFYKDLPAEIIQSRMLLRTVMEKNGFTGINSEWWHFSHRCGPKYPVEDIPFNCDD